MSKLRELAIRDLNSLGPTPAGHVWLEETIQKQMGLIVKHNMYGFGDGRTVTWEQLQEMRGNTAFWTEMFAKMDNNCFIKQAQHYLNNCSFTRHKNTTYDDAIMNTVLPEALNRIAELEAELKRLK